MKKKIILIILLIGTIYKLIMTWNGNFIFHIDSARDMVDVREMVVLEKPRLTGPNTSIPGVYDGPVWYYLLAIPFIISGGEPYASIVLQIILWAIGGFFLLKIISKWSSFLILPFGFLWIASDYINLTTDYAFNPNPVILLTPLFIYLFYKYIETEKIIFAVFTFILGGLFFNFEMSFGIFLPLIIFASILLSKKTIFKKKSFWIAGFLTFIFLIPQIIFNFKYNSIILNGLNAHLQREAGKISFSSREQEISQSFYNLFLPTILNRKLLEFLLMIFSTPVLIRFLKHKEKDPVVIITLCYVFIPFLGYLFLPITVSPWHLGGPMVGLIILVGFVLRKLWDINIVGKFISFILAISIFYFSLFNIFKFFLVDIKKPNMDPSVLKNEIAAINYVYEYAKGKNFKVYSYLPSVYDYPYQYLFWWYGKKQYGYVPGEYAYAPNKPQYISNKEKFDGRKDNFSGLVFLIKEPDRIYMRQAWENDFVNMEFVSKEWVGPLEVEIRKEVTRL